MQKSRYQPHLWEKALYGWLMFCALLPIYGSWLNVNFAALQPDHLHLYGDEVELDHHKEDELFAGHGHDGHAHPHGVGHGHDALPETAVSPPAADAEQTVTYLPNLNSLLLILTAIFLTLLIAPLLRLLPELIQSLVEAIQPVVLVSLAHPSDPPRR